MKPNNLHNIKETGFKVPKDYFENFETSILSKANLKGKASNFGFTIPKDYFEKVESDILTKVSKKEPIKVISLFNRKNIIYISSIAAAILLLINLLPFNNTINFDTLDTETVDTYILNNIESNEIAALFTNHELNENNFIDYNLSDETLDYYLENLDETELIFE